MLIENLEAGIKQSIVTYGTSLTAGGMWVQQLETILKQKYPGQIKIMNSGGNGMNSQWGLQNIKDLVIQKRPDTVIIEFAINDAVLRFMIPVEQARKNLERMIYQILESNSRCEIVLMVMNPPIGEHAERRPQIMDYYKMYRNVAREQGFLLIDHFMNWEKLLIEDPNLFKEYIPDGLHPGEKGTGIIITPEILKVLGIEDSTS